MVLILILQDNGISASDISKLKTAGICTVAGIAYMSRKQLKSIPGIGEKTCEKLMEVG